MNNVLKNREKKSGVHFIGTWIPECKCLEVYKANRKSQCYNSWLFVEKLHFVLFCLIIAVTNRDKGQIYLKGRLFYSSCVITYTEVSMPLSHDHHEVAEIKYQIR